MVAELEQRAETAEARVVSLETEVAKPARSGCVEGRRGGDQEDVLDQMRDGEDGRGGDVEWTTRDGRALDECDRGKKVFGRTASNRPLVHKVLRHLRLLQ